MPIAGKILARYSILDMGGSSVRSTKGQGQMTGSLRQFAGIPLRFWDFSQKRKTDRLGTRSLSFFVFIARHVMLLEPEGLFTQKSIKKKMRSIKVGRALSTEHRKKLSDAKIGKRASEETRKKMSDAGKALHARRKLEQSKPTPTEPSNED